MSNALRMIPLEQLKPCKANVRKTQATADIDQLAASIVANGVLENLIVCRVEATSDEPEVFEVIAGERRRRALRLLLKRKKIDVAYRVPCLVLKNADASQVTELSLAENIVRAPLHPADQFDAFAKLRKDGLPPEDIAARFGLTATVVQQRLKLAAVSPRLMAVYRTGDMTLEQMMAFTLTDEHSAQEAVWFDNPFSDRSPQSIRRLLTKSLVDAADRRALFVGAVAYQQAGGVILRDLFQSESEGYFTDSQLLDSLVAEKLAKEAEKLRCEGWSWVEMQESTYGPASGFGRIKPQEITLSKRDEARLAKLSERYDQLISVLEEDGEDTSVAGELDNVTEELEVLRTRKETWPDEDKARAGAIINLDFDGSLNVTRGLLKPEHQKIHEAEEGALSGSASEERTVSGYSESLLVDLSAHRTAALREVLASKPVQAMTALLHVLVLRIFFFQETGSCLRISPEVADLKNASKTIGESKAALALVGRHNGWVERLPEIEQLWSWLSELSAEDRLELLAYCIAVTVDALHRPGEPIHKRSEDALARVLSLDMADWWRPTACAFFDRIKKEQILTAVEEGVSRAAMQPLVGRKKNQITARAEELLAPTRWLPEPLRTGVESSSLREAAE